MRRPLAATACTERDICSIDAAFCSTAVARLSVIAPTCFDRRRHLVDRRRGLFGGRRELVGVAGHAANRLRHLLDRRRGLGHRRVQVIGVAPDALIDAAISLIDVVTCGATSPSPARCGDALDRR